MKKNSEQKTPKLISIGYDLQTWEFFGEKEEIMVDVSEKKNSHILLCGATGSGKSYAETYILAKIALVQNDGIMYFADYKREDEYECLRTAPRYYPYEKTTEALDIVYETMKKRQSGEDISRNKITLCIDEYVAYVLAMQNFDKKKATVEMNKIAELLMLARSMNIGLMVSCQRSDASAFPSGSRLNFGIIIILGSASKSTYEMLMPDYVEKIMERKYGLGEGVVLLYGSDLRFIKIPKLRDESKVQKICIDALTR